MDIKLFCEKRPYLYHLTDASNLEHILSTRGLFSTEEIVNMAMPKTQAKVFLESKRDEHKVLLINGRHYKIRDQQPILMQVLERSLSNGMTAAHFIHLLNKRVFWWPNLNRLTRHFARYQFEKPVILRVESEEMFILNDNAEFCHLNSGATRCHPKYGGNAPTRGKESFLVAEEYDKSIASVAEVTFLKRCVLPEKVWISNSPLGKWRLI